jgi:hypothetical protein
MSHRIHALLLGAALLAVPAGAAAASAAPAADGAGFLYGKLKTESGNVYQGFLRWGNEEASWVDLFNSSKEDNPWGDEVPREHRRRRHAIELFGIQIAFFREDRDFDRQFAARFGDIRKIERLRGDEAKIWMKSGAVYEVEGGSNDLEDEVTVWDEALGEVEVEWRKIDTVEFQPAPAGATPPSRRLYGTVRTGAGTFTGPIQWDQDECLANDILDGETDDGDVEIEMGRIRSIERLSRRASRVTLLDGRTLEMSGTNDVDDDNRGIYVDDRRFGRVLVSWRAFDRVDFIPAPAGGLPGYGDFAPGRPLHGTVTDEGGATLRGRLVFDVDEAESWELLDGDRDDVSYSIPFALIAAVVPDGSSSSRIVLRGGAELVLEDSTDVDEDNSGVLVFVAGDAAPRYVPWERVRRIDFQP